MKASDIVIVGAGPGGCAVSLFLSKAEIPHTIIEKSEFPRDKICGDALSGKTMYVLNQLDTSIAASMQQDTHHFLPSWGVQFIAPNGRSIDIPFAANPKPDMPAPGFISRRMDFDAFLFSKLDTRYAHILTGHELISSERTTDSYRLHIKNKSGEHSWDSVKMLVGADGSRSRVAADLSEIKKENKHYCAGIRAYYSGVSGLHARNFIELHFLDEMLPGYLWIFPLPNGSANVGAGMLSDTVSRKHINLKERFYQALEKNPALKERFKNARMEGTLQGWGLPLGSKIRPISGDGYLLIGDAASLIDPFTGEGIGNAMYSGMMAAAHITQCIHEKRFDAAFNKQYDNAFYDRQWDELKLSHTLQKLSNYPWLFNFVVNKAHSSKTLRETISCMFEDLDLRNQFRNPMFYLKLLFNY